MNAPLPASLCGQIKGRNRAVACKLANVTIKTTDWEANGKSPLSWVISQNLMRRHLTASQRAVVAAKAEPMFAALAKPIQLAGPKRGPVKAKLPERGKNKQARRQAADEVGVSERYVQDAKRIAEEAPELLPDIEAGKLFDSTRPTAITLGLNECEPIVSGSL